MRLALAFALLVTACGASPAYEPEIPPPPPHDPMGAVPPEPATQGTVVIGDGDGGAPAPVASGLPPLPSSAPIYAPADEPAAPPPAERTVTYATGQWVYADGYGWMWVPNGASHVVVETVPYSYFYTPGWGWNWYVSPWGYGGYRYGGWVRRPYRPVGWRGGWVAPHHVVVRAGGGYRGGGFRGGYHGGGHRR